MKLFKILFISVALAGSVLVYFAAPLARPFLKDFVKQEKVVKVIPEGARFDPQTDVSPVSMQVKQPPAQAATTSTKPPVQREDDDDPPALMGIFRALGREKPEWGIVQTKTNFYGEDGKRLGELPAGVLVVYNESRVSSKGKMVFCMLHYKGKELGPYLMPRNNVSLFTGDYTKLSPNQRANLEAYYKTKGALDERNTELMQQLAEKNPYYTLYKAAYDEYMAHIDESKELAEKRDESEGLLRSRFDDKLRRMKNEEAGLQKKYNEIHAKYKQWKVQNAATLPDISNDAEIKECRSEMQRLAQLIPGLAY